MRTPGLGFALILVLLASAAANARAPAAPQVTMGADIKLLRFDWEPVAGASFYRLWVRPCGSRYIAASERIPASITHIEHPIPVHLRDWARTRYVVTACNSAGCTGSRALNPQSLMLDTIGYIKASNTQAQDFFGQSVALSDDGYTLAVTALNESSNASGVNGNQGDNSSMASGAVYVFRRRGHAWQQEAYLKAGVNQPGQYFGFDNQQALRAFALSADGSMLAVSATSEVVDGLEHAGTVYVFQRTRTDWSLIATLRSSAPKAWDFFGINVDLSDDGRTLKIGSTHRTHIYVRPGNSWRHSLTLAPFYAGDSCTTTRLSGDGQTLVMSCLQSANAFRIVTLKRAGNAWVHAADLSISFGQGRQPLALTPDATVMALTEVLRPIPTVGIYRWVGGNWVRETGIAAPTLNGLAGLHTFGYDLALSADGRLLGIGHPYAQDSGAGISPVVTPGTAVLGAVYLYQHHADTDTWSLRNVIKSPNPGSFDLFGGSVSLSASGRTLAVGAYTEGSNATGINGDREDDSAPEAGAAYLY